jgi:hypothetical protein
MCKLVEEAGVGIRDLTNVMKAFRMKVAWKLKNDNSI